MNIQSILTELIKLTLETSLVITTTTVVELVIAVAYSILMYQPCGLTFVPISRASAESTVRIDFTSHQSCEFA